MIRQEEQSCALRVHLIQAAHHSHPVDDPASRPQWDPLSVLATWAGIVLATFLLGLVYTSSAKAVPKPQNTAPLFGYSETGDTDTSEFYKWHRALGNFKRASRPVSECVEVRLDNCSGDEWTTLINRFSNLSPEDKINAINEVFNRRAYISDRSNWGNSDYWASPQEFLKKGGGDCEDYAIAKYLALRELGIPVEHMRVVVLKVNGRRGFHTVLSVYADGQYLILDNLVDHPVPDRVMTAYTPVYSINEKGWWEHHVN